MRDEWARCECAFYQYHKCQPSSCAHVARFGTKNWIVSKLTTHMLRIWNVFLLNVANIFNISNNVFFFFWAFLPLKSYLFLSVCECVCVPFFNNLSARFGLLMLLFGRANGIVCENRRGLFAVVITYILSTILHIIFFLSVLLSLSFSSLICVSSSFSELWKLSGAELRLSWIRSLLSVREEEGE